MATKPPTAPIVDNFNRASLGAAWTVDVAGLSIDSSIQLQGTGNSGGYMAGPSAPDVEAYFDITVLPSGSSATDVAVRYNPANHACYLVRYEGFDLNDLWLYRQDPGFSLVQLADFAGIPTLSVGDAIGIRVYGKTIEAWYRHGGVWTMAGSATDATYSAAGAVWVHLSSTVVRVDNLAFGAYGNALQQWFRRKLRRGGR